MKCSGMMSSLSVARRPQVSVSEGVSVLRVFRRRRRPGGALARLLSGVTEGCQSWLDEKVFRGVFSAEEDQNRHWDRTSPESVQLNSATWSELDDADPDKGHGFTYGQSRSLNANANVNSGNGGVKRHLCVSPIDPTEAPPPPGKMTPPPKRLIQEEIGAETCQAKRVPAGLAEAPPPSHLHTGGRVSPEHTGEQPLPVPVNMLLSSSVSM